MGQLIVRKIDEATKQRLKLRAESHGVSMEEEVRTILRDALLHDTGERLGLGTEIAALFANVGNNEEPLPEIADEPVRHVDFPE